MTLILLPASMMFFVLSLSSVLLSRGYKEATVVSVFLSTMLSLYLVAPSALPFTFPISLISPITGLMQIIEQQATSLRDMLLSTLPFAIFSLSLFALAGSLVTEESFFVEKRLISKIIDGLDLLTGRESAVFILGSIAVLFALSAQLLLVTVGTFISGGIGFVFIIAVAAITEEIFKSAAPYVMITRNKVKKNLRTGLRLALYSGGGFYVGEKLILLLVAASFLPLTSAYLGIGLLGFLILPFVVHFTTTTIVSVGLVYSRPKIYPMLILISSALHASYNLFIIQIIMNIFGA